LPCNLRSHQAAQARGGSTRRRTPRGGPGGFIGTVIAGLVIVVTGHARADAIASLIVVALMLKPAPGPAA